MSRRSKRTHVEGQRVCCEHQTWLDDMCWCGVVHGAEPVPHDEECPELEARCAA